MNNQKNLFEKGDSMPNLFEKGLNQKGVKGDSIPLKKRITSPCSESRLNSIKRWQERNKDSILKKKKQYYLDNKEHIKKRSLERYNNNTDIYLRCIRKLFMEKSPFIY